MVLGSRSVVLPTVSGSVPKGPGVISRFSGVRSLDALAWSAVLGWERPL
jgi:hypothetical protein